MQDRLDSATGLYSKVKGLLIHLDNAPVLDHLAFTQAYISLNDLETRHTAVPLLKTLALKLITIPKQDAERSREIVEQCKRAYQFESFCLDLKVESIDQDDCANPERGQVLFSQWILYIGNKYKYIKQLNVDCSESKEDGDDDIITQCNPSPIITNSLELALTNMVNLKSYVMEAIPKFTTNMVQVMHNNGMQLEELRLWIINEEKFVQQSQCLKDAKSLQTVKHLSTSNYYADYVRREEQRRIMSTMLKGTLVDWIRQMPLLTHLSLVLYDVVIGETLSLALDILIYAESLVELSLTYLKLDSRADDHIKESNSKSIQSKSKSLKLDVLIDYMV